MEKPDFILTKVTDLDGNYKKLSSLKSEKNV